MIVVNNEGGTSLQPTCTFIIVQWKGLLTHKYVTPCLPKTIENLWPVDVYHFKQVYIESHACDQNNLTVKVGRMYGPRATTHLS